MRLNAYSFVAISGTLSPPRLAIQTVRLLDKVDSTSPKSTGDGHGCRLGWPISEGQTDEMRISSQMAPPSQPDPKLPPLSSMPSISEMPMPDHSTSQVVGSS